MTDAAVNRAIDCEQSNWRERAERAEAALANPLLTGMNIGNGTLDIGLEGAGPQLIAGMFLGVFEKYPDAKNYIEVTFDSPQGPLLVTVVKPGGKTPHQARLEAEAERDALRELLNEAWPYVGSNLQERIDAAMTKENSDD